VNIDSWDDLARADALAAASTAGARTQQNQRGEQ
jgi:hypothetical protein